MYSKKQISLLVLIYAVVFTAALLGFIHYETKKRANDFSDLKSAYELIVNLTGDAISSGYCQWDKMYQATTTPGNNDFLKETLKEIQRTSAYIKAAYLIRHQPVFSEACFSPYSQGESTYIDFKIFDDHGLKLNYTQFLRIELNDSAILADLERNPSLLLSPTNIPTGIFSEKACSA